MAKQEKSPRTRLPVGVKAAFAVLAIGAAALFGGCENETTSEQQQQPIDCGTFSNLPKMRLIDDTGANLVASTNLKSYINTAFGILKDNNDSDYIAIKDFDTKMIVTTESYPSGFIVQDDGMTVKANIAKLLEEQAKGDFDWSAYILGIIQGMRTAQIAGHARVPGTFLSPVPFVRVAVPGRLVVRG
jgi:hypothetical protein